MSQPDRAPELHRQAATYSLMTKGATKPKRTTVVMRLLSQRSQQCVAEVFLLSGNGTAGAVASSRRLFLPPSASPVTRGEGRLGCKAACRLSKPNHATTKNLCLYSGECASPVHDLVVLQTCPSSHYSYLMHALGKTTSGANP